MTEHALSLAKRCAEVMWADDRAVRGTHARGPQPASTMCLVRIADGTLIAEFRGHSRTIEGTLLRAVNADNGK